MIIPIPVQEYEMQHDVNIVNVTEWYWIYYHYLNVLNEYEIDSNRDMYGIVCSMYHLYIATWTQAWLPAELKHII